MMYTVNSLYLYRLLYIYQKLAISDFTSLLFWLYTIYVRIIYNLRNSITHTHLFVALNSDISSDNYTYIIYIYSIRIIEYKEIINKKNNSDYEKLPKQTIP